MQISSRHRPPSPPQRPSLRPPPGLPSPRLPGDFARLCLLCPPPSPSRLSLCGGWRRCGGLPPPQPCHCQSVPLSLTFSLLSSAALSPPLLISPSLPLSLSPTPLFLHLSFPVSRSPSVSPWAARHLFVLSSPCLNSETMKTYLGPQCPGRAHTGTPSLGFGAKGLCSRKFKMEAHSRAELCSGQATRCSWRGVAGVPRSALMCWA